jgi:hypothetical protein
MPGGYAAADRRNKGARGGKCCEKCTDLAPDPSWWLLFQADLLRVNEPGGPVTGTRAAADLLRIVQDRRLDVVEIAGLRGRIGTMAELRAAAGPGPRPAPRPGA